MITTTIAFAITIIFFGGGLYGMGHEVAGLVSAAIGSAALGVVYAAASKGKEI